MFRMSGGSEFQSLGAERLKALLPMEVVLVIMYDVLPIYDVIDVPLPMCFIWVVLCGLLTMKTDSVHNLKT